jgi:glycerophosphoryl diester phosphodiesterase
MQIIAHRGASGYAPENTRAAFERAIAMGADAIETDVQLTADGVLVLFHDTTVERNSANV